ncbi:ABC transporter ATP-binding protein [Nocardioides sp. KR10-350]|uniref:ABC transporter ATP-binding protein n=1 Tax=Nocardioides cheoyonin TaxID=3156615 RepID=UPI0032B54009
MSASAAVPLPRSGGADPMLSVSHAQIGYVVGDRRQVAVGDVGFEVTRGSTTMLLGPSGCGKSTLLKAVAGYLRTWRGTISVSGHPVGAPGPDRAVVFQEFDQLFPWRTVRGNLEFPQRANGRGRVEARRRTDELLELMGLTAAADRHPHQLSGGMKQRVAIARALALDPDVLLMDEPFGALDAQTRSRLQRELKAVAARTGVTVLFVTHSIQEAVYVGDEVVVLSTPPSTVLETLDVRGLDDPTDRDFVAALARLRGLLAGDDDHADPDLAHAAFE